MPHFISKSLCQKLNFGFSTLHIICKRYVADVNDGRRALTPPWRILFFGSDDFSKESLKKLYRELRTGVVGRIDVVTSLQAKSNSVKKFAAQKNICIHGWPYTSLAEDFDVGIVVSFGHLIPEKIISSFPLGMLNVHASLLPRWRGAAPIIHAIMHGDATTGVSIMKIKPKKFDVGDIVKQESCCIHPDETMPELHSRLAVLGAKVLMECIYDLPHSLAKAVPQPCTNVTYASKVSAAMAEVRWQVMSAARVYNLHRAISSIHPLTTSWHGLPIRLYGAMPSITSALGDGCCKPGYVQYQRSSATLRVMCADGLWIHFRAIGVPNKKPLSPVDFYNGYLSKKKDYDRIFM